MKRSPLLVELIADARAMLADLRERAEDLSVDEPDHVTIVLMAMEEDRAEEHRREVIKEAAAVKREAVVQREAAERFAAFKARAFGQPAAGKQIEPTDPGGDDVIRRQD